MLRHLTSHPPQPAPRVRKSGPRYWIESAVFLSLLAGLATLLLTG